VAGATRTKLTALSFSTQETVLIDLPDLPGQVLQVGRVLWMPGSFAGVTAVSIALHHNTSLAGTLALTDFGSMWMRIDQHLNTVGYYVPYDFEPPLELVGRQRCDVVSSSGTVTGVLAILYTLRTEPNRTLWNDLRARTSFERG